MGLDAVELILAIEDEFQITITDEEAVQTTTPAKLTDIVYSKLRHSQDEICPSQHGFYTVRHCLMEQLSIPRSRIKPDTALDELLIKKERRKYWPLILSELSQGQTVAIHLEKPKWLKNIISLITLLIVIAFITAILFSNYIAIFFVLAGLIFVILVEWVTVSIRYEFPASYRTVKDLIKICGTLQTKTWEKDDVYLRIRKIISEQLGLNEEEIFPDSHFAKDLGMS